MIVGDSRCTKYQLVLIPPAKWTSFPFELPSDGADLSQLSVHGEPPLGVTLAVIDQRTILLDIEPSVSREGRESGYQKEGLVIRSDGRNNPSSHILMACW